MRKSIVFIIMLMPLLAMAQSPFTVKGNGPGLKDGDKIWLVYKVNEKVINDSAVVVNHSFEIKGNVAGPVAASVYQNENPMLIEISYNSVALYLEPGNILITAPDSIKRAVISGTHTNEDLMALNAIMKPLQGKYVALNAIFYALNSAQKQDINIVADFRRKRQLILQEMEPVKFNFIKDHPNSYISLVTVDGLKRDDAPIQRVAAAYASLSDGVKVTALGKKLHGDITGATKSALGVMAMDFTLPDVNGKAVKLSDFKGKYVLIDFWASWCGPCRAENPFVIAAYNKYNDKGFTVLGVSLDEQRTKKDWLKAIKADGLTWTQVSDLKGWKNKVVIQYGVTSIPANFLIDPTGKIVAINVKDKVLDNTLEELLSTK